MISEALSERQSSCSIFNTETDTNAILNKSETLLIDCHGILNKLKTWLINRYGILNKPNTHCGIINESSWASFGTMEEGGRIGRGCLKLKYVRWSIVTHVWGHSKKMVFFWEALRPIYSVRWGLFCVHRLRLASIQSPLFDLFLCINRFEGISKGLFFCIQGIN